MLGFFNLGLPELIILLAIPALMVAGIVGIVLLVVFLTRSGRRRRQQADEPPRQDGS